MEQTRHQTMRQRNKHVPSQHLDTWAKQLLAWKQLPAKLALMHEGLRVVVADLAIENLVQNETVGVGYLVGLAMPAL